VAPGQWGAAGEPLATIFARDGVGVDEGRAVLRRAIVIADEGELALPLISHRVTGEGVLEYAKYAGSSVQT
jgi:hypothetical protein